MSNDDRLVNYLYFLSFVVVFLRIDGFGSNGLGHYGFLIVDIKQVISVFFLQATHGGITIPIDDIGLCRFELFL